MKNNLTSLTYAKINLDNIKSNYNNIKKSLKPNTKFCGVVKANAYGHGAIEVAKFLENEGVDYLCVARLEEAIELRNNNITSPILCLGFTHRDNYKIAMDNKVDLTIYSLDDARILNNIGKEVNKIANIHIKIDTGMNRLGFLSTDSSIRDIYEISKMKNVNISGIFTHFACADETLKEFTFDQVNKFDFVCNELEKLSVNVGLKHVSNSAATIDLPNFNYDMIRCGIILYGNLPSDEVSKININLKSSMTLKSTVTNVKTIDKNLGISYGLKYKTNKSEKIATISIGYADGFMRGQSNPRVSINNKTYKIVGRICMDQCMALIDDDSDIKIGDEVILFGDSSSISADDIADDLGTINYEILCSVSRRVDRVYIKDNKAFVSSNYLLN